MFAAFPLVNVVGAATSTDYPITSSGWARHPALDFMAQKGTIS